MFKHFISILTVLFSYRYLVTITGPSIPLNLVVARFTQSSISVRYDAPPGRVDAYEITFTGMYTYNVRHPPPTHLSYMIIIDNIL